MTVPSPRLTDITSQKYRSAQLNVTVRLNSNESPFAPSSQFWDRFTYYSATTTLNRYPDRGAWLVRERLGNLSGVGPECVYVANGSNEVLLNTMLAFGGPQRKYASAIPTYGMYAQIATTTATSHIPVARTATGEIDSDDFAQGVTKANLAIVCSPNNPTGKSEDLVSLARLTPPSTLFVADEAYFDFSLKSPTLTGENVERVRTFSKSMALAGARVGYCIASREIVEILWAISLPYHLDTVKQCLILSALDSRDGYDEHIGSLIATRERSASALRDLGCHVFESEANFLLFSPPGSAKVLWDGLVAHSILIRDATSWPGVTNCLRVTIGTDEEMDTFLRATKKLIAQGDK